jgi:hypothetical protein
VRSYYDVGNPTDPWSVVKITWCGWNVVDSIVSLDFSLSYVILRFEGVRLSLKGESVLMMIGHSLGSK